jgi:hypothetical protein
VNMTQSATKPKATSRAIELHFDIDNITMLIALLLTGVSSFR